MNENVKPEKKSKGNRVYLLSIAVIIVVSGLALASAAGIGNPAKTPVSNKPGMYHVPVCPGSESGAFRCHSHVIVDSKGSPITSTTPTGYGPAQFHGAYGLSVNATSTQTIAIVDAYDDPNALSDLNTYSTNYGIPTMANCAVSTGTASKPCFQKVNQKGGTSYPRANSGWALEITLDVQIAHAMCQNCNILLVEANSNRNSDLMSAVDRAVNMGAGIISNSYGSGESSGETSYDSHFNHPGIAITFSSGDNGYGVEYPAASRYVTAVGGTTLNIYPNNSYNYETAWSGAGSGCSVYETKPSWQTDTGCSRRTVADVSADADPSTGAAIYDSFGYMGQAGWFEVGGTSLASPLTAGVYALAGGVAPGTYGNSIPYSVQSLYPDVYLNDIIGGSNGNCGGSYLCTAVPGYDGPTGLGTPIGTGAY